MMSLRIAAGLLLLLSISLAIVIFGQRNSCDLVIVDNICLGGNIEKVINARGTSLKQSGTSNFYRISATKEFPISTRIITNGEEGIITQITLNCTDEAPIVFCREYFTKIAETNNIKLYQTDVGWPHTGRDAQGYYARLNGERSMHFRIRKAENEPKK